MHGVHTHQSRIAIDGVDDLLIRSLADRRQYADPRGHAERLGISSAAWPLFGLCWPSGVALAKRLGQRPVTAGERILEVGCGLALPSLVGHRRGVDITASDCHPLAAGFLRANLRLNGLAPMDYRHGQWSRARLDCAHGSIVRGRFDLVIGSDLLYERDEAGALAAFIGRHASAQGQVWIVDPDRANRAPFHRRMDDLGFGGRDEERLDTPAYRGRLITYRRR
jgi:predicted nicotinamide N-methyase